VDRTTLLTLSRDDLIALIEAQPGQIAALAAAHAQQIATLTARIVELEAKLALPPKNPDNSSLPPSKGEGRTFESCRIRQPNQRLRRFSSSPENPAGSMAEAGNGT